MRRPAIVAMVGVAVSASALAALSPPAGEPVASGPLTVRARVPAVAELPSPVPDGCVSPPRPTPPGVGLDYAVDAIVVFGQCDPDARRYYLRTAVCQAASLCVYRVRGSGKFDSTVRDLGRERKVEVYIFDALYSIQTADELAAEVFARRGALAAAGAPLVHTVPDDDGRLEVGVEGNFGAARDVLADLGDKVVVVPGEKVTMTRATTA